MSPRNRLLAIIVLALVVFPRAHAFGDDRPVTPPVFVSFRFEVESVRRRFDNKLSDAETAIATELAKHVESKFQWWRFEPGGPNNYPRVQVSLTKINSEWRISAAFLANPNSQNTGRWSVVLYKPGDLDLTGEPTRSTWPGEIIGGVDTFFLPTYADAIRQVLKESAPLGTSIAHVFPPPPPTADKAQAILPLSWDKYSLLGTSDFLIVTNWPTHGRVKLLSAGTGSPAEFPGPPKFMAITVQIRTWTFAEDEKPIDQKLGNLGELTPIAIYLWKEDPTGAATVAPDPR